MPAPDWHPNSVSNQSGTSRSARAIQGNWLQIGFAEHFRHKNAIVVIPCGNMVLLQLRRVGEFERVEVGRGKKVILGSMSFDNQSQAKDFFRAMLNRYIPGERISAEDSPHLGFLFERHPEYATKIGSGIDHFEVMPADYGTQCFCAVGVDGSKEGFSYIKCVTQKVD